jgi:alkanesulfonate monooxygenase SsuD/methylene tetrahydromethanopterin reductase-like flavin-dependent oxidoreductase (luciferase family)
MPDYGHDLKFGYFLIPDAGDPSGVLATARLIDELGYDLVGIQDHPYNPGHLDALSLMAVILGQTRRIRVVPTVANLGLRPPVMLAKAAASLDQISGGRFELGLGTGAFREAIASMGGPVRSPGENLRALAEAIEIIRAMWRGTPATHYSGKYYQLAGLHPGPAPAHDIGIWVGAQGPRALGLTGRAADGWVSPMMSYRPPGASARLSTVIDDAAREAGRSPAAIRRIYPNPGAFTASAPRPASDADQQIVGPVDHWVQVLEHLAADFGFSTFLLVSRADPRTLRTFMGEVAPRVRERVAARRAAEQETRV